MYTKWFLFQSSMPIYGPRGPGYAHKEYRPYDLQDIQYRQDKTNEAVMMLESNTDILRSLRAFYMDLLVHKDFPEDLKSACNDEIANFSDQLDEMIDDFLMQTSRAKLLVKIISDGKELVSQHLQGQAAERTEKLNQNLEKEAIVVRIVTIVTLVYLPATFVSVSHWALEPFELFSSTEFYPRHFSVPMCQIPEQR